MANEKKRSSKNNPLKNNFLLKMVLSQMAGQPMRLIRASWGVDKVTMHPAAEALLQSGEPVIYALWHGRMYLLFKSVPLDQVAILVSPSNDGEFITRIAQCVGFRHFVRGSHKRGGRQAIVGLHKALKRDRHSIAFTVDGPRGPRYVVKPGIIRLASLTGAPIIPLGASSRWLLSKFDRAWDHFHAPMPFTGLHLTYGEPLHVPAGLDEEGIEQTARQLEAELMKINLEADQYYGFQNKERL